MNISNHKFGGKLIYEYDFGDSWTHLLKVEKILPAKQDTFYPVCTDGTRACPPEDCGGFPGQMALLEALANPDDEDNAERIEWIGEDYELEKIDHTGTACHRHTSYRELVIRPWRLLYRIDRKRVYVIALLDSRCNLKDILLERLINAE